MIRRILARIGLALASFGALRAALPTTRPDDRARVVDAFQEWEVESLDVEVRAGFHAELHARYAGPRTALSEQLDWMRGRRWANACLNSGGIGDEFEKFVSARTRAD